MIGGCPFPAGLMTAFGSILIFIAESWKEFENCEEKHYNRVLTNEEFKKLWNTGMWKMPLYRNTYLTAVIV